MEKIKQVKKLRKGWKIFGAALLSIVLLGSATLFATASSTVRIELSQKDIQIDPTQDMPLTATLSGNDENTADQLPVNNWVTWTSSNEDVVEVIGATGLNPTLRGFNAGKSIIRGDYTTKKYDEFGNLVPGSESVIATASVVAYVPLTIQDSSSDNIAIDAYHAHAMDTTIGFYSNASNGNIGIKSNNGVGANAQGFLTNNGIVEVQNIAGSNIISLKVVGGGKTDLTVLTLDNVDEKIEQLIKRYTVIGEIKYDTSGSTDSGSFITLPKPYNGTQNAFLFNDKDFETLAPSIIPSNIKYPDKAGVRYRSTDNGICRYSNGTASPIKAGVVTLTAGVEASYAGGVVQNITEDRVNVIIPFKKLGNQVTDMNVGDQLQLQTSGDPRQVRWSTEDNTILDVDNNGLVTAKKAGKAKVVATHYEDNPLFTELGYSNQLVYEITVIDDFGVSAQKVTVNMKETVDISALVTEEDLEKNPITFTVENQANEDGTIPTGTVISVVQEGKVFHVTGVKSGVARITISQNVNGVIKSDYCTVYVTTPVTDMYINPGHLQIDRGSSETVQLIFDPADPTNRNVLWGTSNPDVVTVEGDSYTATVTGVKGGSAIINVISEDGLKTATCEVYVREPVTGIVLNETNVHSSMAVGRFQLVATITPAGEGVNRNVIWSSSDESVLKVDETGLVTFVKPGYGTIICKTEDGAYIATCNFFISIPVTEIKLDYTDEIMSIGDKLRITAEVLPVEASNKNVYWESSNTNVCMVDSNGLVEAVGNGHCTILCKSADGGYTAMCNIYVKQPVTQVILNTSEATVRKGQVFWLNATCLPENADNKIIEWSSRDEEVCTVDKDGKVTAVGTGTTSIIALNPDSGLTAFCVVTVLQPVSGITLNSTYQEMWVGSKYAIIATVEPIDAVNKNVTYMSSDPDVASVDEYGVVTALKGGTTIIEVITEEAHLIATCTIVVKEYVSSLELSEHNKFMNIGSSGTLTVAVGSSTATNKNVIWSSSDNGICSVDQEGNLIANFPGTAIITATAADGSGLSDTCIVRVVNPVTGIRVEPDTVRLLVGDSYIVNAVITPEDASVKEVDWTSSNEAVAVVDEAGEIFAVGVGKCKVTATSKDGNEIKGNCWVYVTPVIDITSVKINSSEIWMLTGKSRQLSVRVRPAVNTDSYEWYSTDTGIVTVDNHGVITTVGPGTADVVVESNAGGALSTCKVHSLGMSRSSIRLEQYDSYWLDVLGAEDNDKIVWRSNNPRVATVTQSGQVIGRMAGTTTITAFVHNKTLSCTVTVVTAKKYNYF